jgi:hypothetical protein
MVDEQLPKTLQKQPYLSRFEVQASFGSAALATQIVGNASATNSLG